MENNYLMLNAACPEFANVTPDREQELAIMFLDIRNFTELMEAQPEQAIIQLVRRLFTGFNQIIKNFQGKVVEVAGDSLYAVFGLQSGLKDAALQAYEAAKMMLKAVDLFNEAYAVPTYSDPLEIGIGLHAGSVFVGEFGLDAQPALSVMGLAVNIASRLQAKTRELNNDLIISDYVYRLIGSGKETFALQTVSLKGISYGQQIRLAGKPYANSLALNGGLQHYDYLLAISG
jgi:adenylate cyclase